MEKGNSVYSLHIHFSTIIRHKKDRNYGLIPLTICNNAAEAMQVSAWVKSTNITKITGTEKLTTLLQNFSKKPHMATAAIQNNEEDMLKM
jgi:hypothetical protein